MQSNGITALNALWRCPMSQRPTSDKLHKKTKTISHRLTSLHRLISSGGGQSVGQINILRQVCEAFQKIFLISYPSVLFCLTLVLKHALLAFQWRQKAWKTQMNMKMKSILTEWSFLDLSSVTIIIIFRSPTLLSYFLFYKFKKL